MIIEFSIENYRSFKELQTLNLQAAKIKSKDATIDSNNTFRLTDKLSLLKSKAIYGANASGKSNLLLALRDFKRIVSSSLKDDSMVPIQGTYKFRLSDALESTPMFFQLILLCSDTIYRYGFGIHESKICAEWLYGIPEEKETYFFEREDMEIRVNETRFKEGKRIIPSSSGAIPLIQPTSLFLAVVAAFNGPLAKSIVAAIDEIQVLAGNISTDHISKHLKKELKSAPQLKKINSILRGFDLGFEKLLSADFGDIMSAGLKEKEKNMLSELEALSDEVVVLRKKYNEQGKEVGQAMFFLEDEEAEGSKKLVILSPFIINALEKGSTLAVDEFDAKMHPNLTRKIVELFHDPAINNKNAQLIFVTHDSNLLDHNFLRRDQICFVEKDKYGASTLTNLVEYKGVRNDASYEKNYLRGKYGAIPYLGRFQRAFENS